MTRQSDRAQSLRDKKLLIAIENLKGELSTGRGGHQHVSRSSPCFAQSVHTQPRRNLSGKRLRSRQIVPWSGEECWYLFVLLIVSCVTNIRFRSHILLLALKPDFVFSTEYLMHSCVTNVCTAI